MNETEWISKSEAGRRLDVSRTMVAKYVARGCPSNEAGMVPWPDTQEWVRRNILSMLSGNWAHRHAERQLRAKAEATGKRRIIAPIEPKDVKCSRCQFSAQEYRLHYFCSGAVNLLNNLRRPELLLTVAECALAIGLTPQQAYVVGTFWDLLLGSLGREMIPEGPISALKLKEYDSPAEQKALRVGFAALAGVAPDEKAWKKVAFEGFDKVFYPEDGPEN